MLKYKVFDGMTALADFAETEPAPGTRRQDNDFCKGTMDNALKFTREGDLSGVAASDALLSKFEQKTFETMRKVWIDDVWGNVPNVPAYIAGHPLNMRRRVKRPAENGAITIVVDLFASAYFSHDVLEKRGAAVLALARILAISRPTSLYVGFGSSLRSDHVMPFVRIETSPLDLARASYAMTSPLFLRRVLFAANEALDETAFPFPRLAPGKLKELAAAAFPHAEQTILVPGIVSDQADVVKDPQAWIIEQMQKTAPELLAA